MPANTVAELLAGDITIEEVWANGTGATAVRFTLPVNGVAATDQGGFVGRENHNTGKEIFGVIDYTNATDVTRVIVRYYDNTYPGSDGNVLVISGWYESA